MVRRRANKIRILSSKNNNKGLPSASHTWVGLSQDQANKRSSDEE